jgi:hypothetical protein
MASLSTARLLAVALLLAVAGCAETGLYTTDTSRERALAKETAANLAKGELVELKTDMKIRTIGRESFVGVLAEAKSPAGAVVILNDREMGPDGGFVGRLRVLLVDRGYTTLSIQQPLLGPNTPAKEYEFLFEDAGDRIGVATKYLQSKGYSRIALVGYGMGARMAEFYVNNVGENPMFAWVPVSISNGEFARSSGLRIPTLDIYAESDSGDVLKGAPIRSALVRTAPKSRQIRVAGASASYAGKEREVANDIARFLDGATK